MALCRVARVGLPARLRANFGAMWAWRRLQPPAACLGTRCRPLRPALSRCRGRAWEHARSRAGSRRDRQVRQGSAGRDRKQRRRARPYDQCPSSAQRVQPVPAPAGRSIVGDRAQIAKDRYRAHSGRLPNANPGSQVVVRGAFDPVLVSGSNAPIPAIHGAIAAPTLTMLFTRSSAQAWPVDVGQH